MKIDAAQPYAASFIIFRNELGQVAFLLRKNTNWMDGFYGLPAGKVDPGESFRQAAFREAQEEVGVVVTDLVHVLTAHRTGEEDGMTWVDTAFEARSWEGELSNAEPDKHASLEWFDVDSLPENVIPVGKFYLEQIAAGNHYAEYGWPS